MTAQTATPVRKTSGLPSSSPADTESRKRTRSALRSLNINDGSPDKRDVTKPPRKSSRAATNSLKSDKENVLDVSDGQENMGLDF